MKNETKAGLISIAATLLLTAVLLAPMYYYYYTYWRVRCPGISIGIRI